MRKKVVVDTSIAIKWVLDEPDSSLALALLFKWIDEGTEIRAPALLAYEVANVLYQRVRKGELSAERAKKGLEDVLLIELELNLDDFLNLGKRAIELAHLYSLPAAYDPHYLALAEREQCDYWTADTRLWNAIGGKLPWVRRLADYKSMLH
ncbi:MAG TPA: type II toxin-antitoxin system VapC family toxin [Ktedonobacteraceae bacterium]|nr:type II toxin-antitoxin system VapC family toxin [Ktedonobacteraceae bacterium]